MSPKRAAEVEFCAAEARPEATGPERFMVCHDGKSWCMTIDRPEYAARHGWRYVHGGLSEDAADVLLLALAFGLARDEEDPKYTEPASLRRLRRAAGVADISTDKEP